MLGFGRAVLLERKLVVSTVVSTVDGWVEKSAAWMVEK
jgi:hypothetical protein